MARFLTLLLTAYLISVHWLGWGKALAAPLLAIVLFLLLAYWLGKRKLSVTQTPGDATTPNTASNDAADTRDFPELVPAIASLERQAYAKCIKQAAPYIDDSRVPLRADALRLHALAWSRLEDYARARPCWEQLAAIEPSPSNWLNVATSRAMTHDFDGSEDAFAQMQRLHNEAMNAPPRQNAFMPMETANYLTALDRAGRPDLAMPWLDQIADFYCGMHITDSQFLYSHHMPFFGIFLQQSLPIVRKVMSPEKLRSWYRTIYESVDENGKSMLATSGIPY